MGNTVIETKDLDYTIEDAQILHSVSIAIEKREFVGLIGPNGCGKSTLLKNIYRRYKADHGAIYLDGKSMNGMNSKQIARKMAVVVQENTADFDFSVLEMVMMGRYAHKKLFQNEAKEDVQICEQALRDVGLEKLRDRSFLSLSGGEKQRIYLAMAFAQQSDIIVLDEPTNHLDIGYQLAMMETLRRFQDKTIFTSVHDMNLAAWFCDRLIVMNHGEIIVTGTPEEVLTPKLIRDVFHVESEVFHRPSDGKLSVAYLNYVNQ
ncbi:MAG: ABC transporter ATP-binding protein [Eubacteriales bacterium]|nr:ABC transporter ATP-binding protein [Eubacteriales bacterium]